MIGAPRRRASSATSGPASIAPPPAQISGRQVEASSSSASATPGGSSSTSSNANSPTSQDRPARRLGRGVDGALDLTGRGEAERLLGHGGEQRALVGRLVQRAADDAGAL